MSGQGESALLENLQKSREKDKFCSTVQVKTANTTRRPFCQRNQSTTSWSSKAEASTQKEWEACGKNLSREKEPLILDQSIPEASYTIIHSKIIIIITATTIFILAIIAISPSSKGVAIHQLFPEGLMISQMARCRSSFCNLSCITQIGGRPIEESHHYHPHHHPHHRHRHQTGRRSRRVFAKRELHQTQIGDGGAVSRTHVVQCLVQRAVSGTHFNSIIHHRWAPAKDLCQSFSLSRFFEMLSIARGEICHCRMPAV